MGAWFWLNIPLAAFFFCCWAGIPLWLTGTRWHAEISSKHAGIAAKYAELAAGAVAEPAVAARPPAAAALYQTAGAAYTGTAGPRDS